MESQRDRRMPDAAAVNLRLIGVAVSRTVAQLEREPGAVTRRAGDPGVWQRIMAFTVVVFIGCLLGRRGASAADSSWRL